MKTSIDLPDEVLHRAKVVAAQKRTTLKDLIVSGLQNEIAGAGGARDETDALIEALAKGRNTKPVGRLRREEIYDRPILR